MAFHQLLLLADTEGRHIYVILCQVILSRNEWSIKWYLSSIPVKNVLCQFCCNICCFSWMSQYFSQKCLVISSSFPVFSGFFFLHFFFVFFLSECIFSLKSTATRRGQRGGYITPRKQRTQSRTIKDNQGDRL